MPAARRSGQDRSPAEGYLSAAGLRALSSLPSNTTVSLEPARAQAAGRTSQPRRTTRSSRSQGAALTQFLRSGRNRIRQDSELDLVPLGKELRLLPGGRLLNQQDLHEAGWLPSLHLDVEGRPGAENVLFDDGWQAIARSGEAMSSSRISAVCPGKRPQKSEGLQKRQGV